jgi:chemotaxis protein CheZ
MPDADPTSSEVRVLRAALRDITRLIDQTRIELADLLPLAQQPALLNASGTLESVVGTTAVATDQIMSGAEHIQRNAGLLRMAASDREDALQAIEAHALDIIMACSFQDLTGQRIRRVVQALASVEARIQALGALWRDTPAPMRAVLPIDPRPDAHLLHGPSDDGLLQDAVDRMFSDSVEPDHG